MNEEGALQINSSAVFFSFVLFLCSFFSVFIIQIVAHWVYRSVSFYPRNPCLLFLIVDLDSKSCRQAGLPFGAPLTFLVVCTPTPDSFKDDINPLLSSLFTTKVSSTRQFKNHIEFFSTLLDESRDIQM